MTVFRGPAYIDSCAVDDDYSSYVDMYNATSNSWTTYPEGLGMARGFLAAASSTSGLVFFLGGSSSTMLHVAGFFAKRIAIFMLSYGDAV
jgi:hypothetical protein